MKTILILLLNLGEKMRSTVDPQFAVLLTHGVTEQHMRLSKNTGTHSDGSLSYLTTETCFKCYMGTTQTAFPGIIKMLTISV